VTRAASTGPPATILVVDDDHLMRWSLEHQLRAAGHVVLQASGAAEALQQVAAAGPVALALLDVRLPDGDGLELLGRIKTVAPGCRVIMMSGVSSPETMGEALRSGADAFVLKPFDLDDVLQVVADALA
jgi:DNA-binding NtrC family response regulator